MDTKAPRPLVKWAGGKSRLAGEILGALGAPRVGVPGGRYIEPFCGSAAVWLLLQAREPEVCAVLADASPQIVGLLRACRDRVDDLLTEAGRLPTGPGWREHYAGIRDVYNVLDPQDVRAAGRLLWLNRAGFNGLHRVNAAGKLNVPPGDYEQVRLPSEAEVRAVSQALQRAEIRLADFRTVLMGVRAGDRVYCDPPYVASTWASSFTGYAAGGFGPGDQKALAGAASQAAAIGARVVISNADTEPSRRLYPLKKGFAHRVVEAHRSIGRSADSRRRAQELIVSIGPFAALEVPAETTPAGVAP